MGLLKTVNSCLLEVSVGLYRYPAVAAPLVKELALDCSVPAPSTLDFTSQMLHVHLNHQHHNSKHQMFVICF